MCAALLRGEVCIWPQDASASLSDRLLDYCAFHGIEVLAHVALQNLPQWPEQLRSELRQRTTHQAMRELRERAQLQRLCSSLAAEGIDSLIFKGAALAYFLYENPVWRSRSDCDLLVPELQLQQTLNLLHRLGYQQHDSAAIGYQLQLVWSSEEGGAHCIDLHWKLNNSELLSRLFSFRELQSRSMTLPKLASDARTVSAADALLIACLHRGVHKLGIYTVNDVSAFTGDRLIWLKDIDLLARSLQTAEWQQFYALANSKGMSDICQETLALAASLFHTPLPADWQAQLHNQGLGRADRYFSAGPFGRGWLNLCAFLGWRNKLGYCRKLLFPPAAYMRIKFAAARCQWLPWLYMRRIVGGLLQRLQLGWQQR